MPLPPATTFDVQLAKMRSRGLAIEDEALAVNALGDLNYYRLRGCWLTLERDGTFLDGTDFEDVLDIYRLDRELRQWLWRAIAPIEVKLRTQFAYHFAHACGPSAYLEPERYRLREGFDRSMRNYSRERDRSYDHGVPFVVHNMDKYGKLPVWAAVEVMSFGTLSMLYGNVREDAGVQRPVARAFGTKPYYLVSWAHHLSTVRNIAAHHDRFYNRVMDIRPNLLRRDAAHAGSKQFPTLVVIRRVYEHSWPDEWSALGGDLTSIIDGHPRVSLVPMGFPTDWRHVLGIA